MDEIIFALILLISIVILISSIIMIHEVLESPYDKCLDNCNYLDDSESLECMKDCNKMFQNLNNQSRGNKESVGRVFQLVTL